MPSPTNDKFYVVSLSYLIGWLEIVLT